MKMVPFATERATCAFHALVAICLPLLGMVGNAMAVDYLTQIKPLLQERCYACHGGLKQEANLRLDTAHLIGTGGDSGAVISNDGGSQSLLIERVSSTDPADRMPPEHQGEPLSADQIDLIRQWIASGAPAPEDEEPEDDPHNHWAFQPIVRPAVPKFDAAWSGNPVDAFISRQHQSHGLTPQPEAARIVLLRRLYIDLIGLPPTLDEITDFLANRSPHWYQDTVDRLLEDPRHGERWARHWMDIWRYSDWWGLGEQLRNSQKHIWHWRDWIIESLNDDTPYDEMVRLMLAADELHPENLDKLRATGYLARNFTLFNRPQWMDETVEHVSKGLLGLTLNCARCHDHKYDPIAQTDYYRMRAFFEPYHVRLDVVPGETDLERDGVPRVFDGKPDEPTYRYVRGDENNPDKSQPIAPGVPDLLAFKTLNIRSVMLPEMAWQPERQPWVIDDEINQVASRVEANQASPKLELELARAELESVKRRAAAMRAVWTNQSDAEQKSKHDEAIRAEQRVAVVLARQAVHKAEAELSAVAVEKKEAAEKTLNDARESLEKAIAAVETEIKPSDTYTRLIGARWTPTRFQFSGNDDPPVEFPATSTGRRSALADWITDRRNPLSARVAANHIWSRHMGRPLVETMFDFGRNGRPPTHPALLDWLAAELMDHHWSIKHLHRVIVSSNAYRMQSTIVGAEQNVANDPENRYWWRRVPTRVESQVVRDSLLSLVGTIDTTIGGPSVTPADQPTSSRRSLYFFHSNNDRNPFLTTFDEALVKDCYRREQSIVPQQALALANSALALDASTKIAASFPTADNTTFIQEAFSVMLGMNANDAEITACKEALDAWQGEQGRARANLIWALINHNDFVTVR